MLTLASVLSHKHDVDIFCDDYKLKEKAHDRLSIDLKNTKIVDNIFNPPINVFRKIITTSKYDLIIMLSDGSIPLLFSKKTVLHFQQPFMKINGSSIQTQLKLRHVSAIICNSVFTKRYIDTEFNVKSTVIYPPVDTANFNHTVQKKNIILSVGRFQPVKKHTVMISAFSHIGTMGKNWQLVLVGGLLKQDEPYFNGLNKIQRERVVLIPNIGFKQLQLLYEEASIYWHAAGYEEDEHTHPERFEHFGIAPVEAMAAACIPLVYNGGGLPEVVDDPRFLWKTTDELIKKTEDFIADKLSWNTSQEWVKERSKKFDIKRFSDNINSLIASLV